jgi:hypothetical protein
MIVAGIDDLTADCEIKPAPGEVLEPALASLANVRLKRKHRGIETRGGTRNCQHVGFSGRMAHHMYCRSCISICRLQPRLVSLTGVQGLSGGNPGDRPSVARDRRDAQRSP